MLRPSNLQLPNTVSELRGHGVTVSCSYFNLYQLQKKSALAHISHHRYTLLVRLYKKKLHVALMNVLHTGSISDEEKKQYDFIFPDFFCLKPEVSIKKYKSFQVFNHKMSISSGRKTSKKTLLLKNLIVYYVMLL